MKVKIYMRTMNEVHCIYLNDKKYSNILVNKVKVGYDIDRFKFKFFDMISDWPKCLEEKSIADGLEYEIKIKENGEVQKYLFKNKFPKDIYRLSSLINDLLQEVKDGI